MRSEYIKYIQETNTEGSNKAGSYIKALDYLQDILAHSETKFRDCNIWEVSSADEVADVYKYVLEQQKLGIEGVFKFDSRPSYWKGGFYSAAIKSFLSFLVEHKFELKLMRATQEENDGKALAEQLESQPIENFDALVDCDVVKKGKENLRAVKNRVNQRYFRKMVLKNYRSRCCITGLPIPAVLRASHISPWSSDKANRLNPSNGLCFSATYDAAFDSHLISLDQKYRIVLSPSLDIYTAKSFIEYFRSFEGRKIDLPVKFFPDLELLEKHCDLTLNLSAN
ncbi:HNH endonuclease [Sedimentisphaera salicampi]|uniref:HNH endonuclease n=1 Tax=Sedimentisphaera salicampi TaxID=1941349 RepID=UPI000B9C204B|nr:HNH endonuclease [Sedimentisphaera salicampi]OXU14780.1 hypothetical protein SMSP1_01469 [Sedimentisphaera salicampi]